MVRRQGQRRHNNSLLGQRNTNLTGMSRLLETGAIDYSTAPGRFMLVKLVMWVDACSSNDGCAAIGISNLSLRGVSNQLMIQTVYGETLPVSSVNRASWHLGKTTFVAIAWLSCQLPARASEEGGKAGCPVLKTLCCMFQNVSQPERNVKQTYSSAAPPSRPQLSVHLHIILCIPVYASDSFVIFAR